MNLDELNNVRSADIREEIVNPSGQYSAGSALQMQPSFTLSRASSKKTVDEVWKNIQHGKNWKNIQHGKNKNGEATGNDSPDGVNRDRQFTLAEITKEDFLQMAGLMTKPSGKVRLESGVVPAVVTSRPENSLHNGQRMHHQLPSVPQEQNILPAFMSANHVSRPPLAVVSAAAPFLDAGFADTQIALWPSSLLGAMSDMRMTGYKRVASEGVVFEKKVGRRQKRAIQQRESAARSRARKQAYTQKLENGVAFLEEENARLRKQRDLDDKVLPPSSKPKNNLRRMRSAPKPL